ncbi:MAG: alpha/beta fold hydrolase [Planctomycetota bacterium]|nr:alpha/beta fold hydrolase [Planctomycetota bacterium]
MADFHPENASKTPNRGHARRGGLILLRLTCLLSILLFIGWATGCMERLFYVPTSGNTPLPLEFPDAESVWFTSEDGTKLHGWFIPGEHVENDPIPSILHVHGNAGNITSHYGFTEYLPGAGFNVFIFDYRGYGQSEGKARNRVDLIADTDAALEAMLQRKDVDPERVGLYGQSLGGAIGLNVMASRLEIKAGVFESSFASWRDIAAEVLGGEKPGFIAKGLASLLINDDHRPIDAAALIDRPLLFLHGTSDSIIPHAHGVRLAEAAADKATLQSLPGGDHNSLRWTHPEVDQLIIDFFRNHLGKSNDSLLVD